MSTPLRKICWLVNSVCFPLFQCVNSFHVPLSTYKNWEMVWCALLLLLLFLLWAERQRVFIRVFSAYARVSLGCWERTSRRRLAFPKISSLILIEAGHPSQCFTVSSSSSHLGQMLCCMQKLPRMFKFTAPLPDHVIDHKYQAVSLRGDDEFLGCSASVLYGGDAL